MTHKVQTISALRSQIKEWRGQGDTIGFVPTMGALHEGHMALVAAAKKRAKRVVVSVFVNPTQFGPNEDFQKYARQIDQDQALLAANGCDLLFAPSVAEMYPEGFTTQIDPGPLTQLLEGACRPGHFSGVAIVVTKLLMQVLPDFAFFGEKDYQQLLVIQRFVKDMDMPVEIVPVPLVRGADGLALSSRNAYLSADEHEKALTLSRTLQAISKDVGAGQAVDVALAQGQQAIEAAGFVVDYLVLCDAQTLLPLETLDRPARVLVAARINATRLIDNMPVPLLV